MIVPDNKSICQSAEPYYYDYLSGDKQEDIPDALWQHISQCMECKTEIYLLKTALNSPEESSNSKETVTAITTNLELHFAHAGQSVSCNMVKPFLPTQVDPLFEIRIPTPITVHIDKCRQCAADLEKIRHLNLSHKQLFRLGQILAKESHTDKTSCNTLQEAISSAGMLEHNKTISSIIDREESGITTCFNKAGESKAQETVSHEDTYANWPIEVNVVDKRTEDNCPPSESASPSGNVTPVQKQRITQGPAYLRLKHLIKPLSAAAAILVVALLALNGPNLKATDLSQIYESLARVKNVHLKSIDPEHSNVMQEIWMSRELEIKMFKNKDQYVLWDLKRKKRVSKDLIAGDINSVDVDEETASDVSQTLIGPLNMLPFAKIAKFPKNSSWHLVPRENHEQPANNLDLYEIVWTDKASDDSLIYRKWRGYVETETKLPTRIEWYEKSDIGQEYELTTVTEVIYLETEALQSILSEIGF